MILLQNGFRNQVHGARCAQGAVFDDNYHLYLISRRNIEGSSWDKLNTKDFRLIKHCKISRLAIILAALKVFLVTV